MRGSNGATTKAVITLSHKVDALYQVVDQLSGKMSDAFSECRLAPIQGTNGVGMDGAGRFSSRL